MSVPMLPSDAPLLPPYHEEFYFEDGNLTLLVENTLFRVFRSSFTRHSAVWRELFELPRPINEPVEGSEDEHPLVLGGISKSDFERLLWIVYPAAHTQNDWTSILDLASQWEFSGIRALAIRELQKLDVSPVDRIVLSRRFDITGRWTLAAYAALCQRPDALSVEEAGRLGLETTVRIAQLREQVHKGCLKHHYQASTSTASRRAGAGPPSYSGRKPREFGQPGDARSVRPSPLEPRNPRKPSALDLYRLVAGMFGIDGAA